MSIGTIHQTIHEASAAVAPAEDELVRAVLESDLLHADETAWPEAKQTLWLWVFVATTATLDLFPNNFHKILNRMVIFEAE